MKLRGLAWWMCAFVLGVMSAAAQGDQRPVNVLFMMTDQHHADWLGCAGNTGVRTPNLDRLAAGGTRFRQMFCPVPYCSPTRAGIVTGLYPSSLGIGKNIDSPDDPLRLREPRETYMKQLAARGYRCHQLGKWHLGEPAELDCYAKSGDAEGFRQLFRKNVRALGDAIYDAGPRPEEKELINNVYLRDEMAEAHRRWKQEKGTPKQDVGIIGRSRIKPQYSYESVLADYCIELLKKHQNEPFAITYSVSPPHAPWIAPAPYYDMYDPAKLPLPATWNDRPEQWAKMPSARMTGIYGEAGFREYLRCYYAQVTMMDEFMGRILRALDELKLADHTLVIFTSDHGNMMGQHGMMDKSHGDFYDDLMRVPLLMRLPGAIPAGKTCDAFASSVDLAATILDYTAAPGLKKTHGRSLRGVIEGSDDGATAVFGERAAPTSPGAARMVRTREWKLCVLPKGQMELFDLRKDPGETKNLAQDAGCDKVVRELSGMLREHMREIGDPALSSLETYLSGKTPKS